MLFDGDRHGVGAFAATAGAVGAIVVLAIDAAR